MKLAYTRAGEVNGASFAVNKSNSGANMISLGYDHAMSKRTTVYALYTRLNNNTNMGYNLGVAATSTGGPTTPPSAGFDQDPSAFAIGLKHTF